MDVKWFFGNDPQPFFQWLPGRPPQTIGDLFKDRLDLSYEVADSDQFRKHRAIKILKPTTELSGMYRCKVSSFVDEDFMQKPMIVYGKKPSSFIHNWVKTSLIKRSSFYIPCCATFNFTKKIRKIHAIKIL